MSNEILILTDGEAEGLTLDKLLRKIPVDKRYRVYNAEIQPYINDINKLKKALKSSYRRLFAKKLDSDRYEKVIMVIDFEQQEILGECLVVRKNFFIQALQEVYSQFICSVVFKNKKYENWIIADPDTIKALKGYNLSNNQIRQVSQTADNVLDAVRYLEQAKSNHFDKVRDSQLIIPKLNVNEMERNSRSFRKMVKEIGIQKYVGISSKNYIP